MADGPGEEDAEIQPRPASRRGREQRGGRIQTLAEFIAQAAIECGLTYYETTLHTCLQLKLMMAAAKRKEARKALMAATIAWDAAMHNQIEMRKTKKHLSKIANA